MNIGIPLFFRVKVEVLLFRPSSKFSCEEVTEDCLDLQYEINILEFVLLIRTIAQDLLFSQNSSQIFIFKWNRLFYSQI